ncbi:DUF2460 domain-containing protein [Elioraea sp.]|jgi:uncharacterized protein (TIGR02217 family)|uniref:DUF2460 domain-containing protein n=1 Tax=Elioraea sp. TaxID=2185103 RepID=UPI0021DDDAB6|nr:DUF2460 domain-containing protein [Elioraea sp.]GIX11605.1 MAG: glycoside hydrolase family 24 [Elioraea sp.]
MAFHDVRFPDKIALGATGGPLWSTNVVTTAGGHERRNQNWAASRGRWNVGSGLKTRVDLETLIAFFRARRGRAFAFRFKDWSDFAMPRQQIGTTDGSTATFQIAKTYTSGPSSQVRAIQLPVAGTVRCWVDGTERTLGGGVLQFQVNTVTGVITLGTGLRSPAGMPVEASCEFDVPARFDADELGLTLENFFQGQWPDITVIEVRL